MNRINERMILKMTEKTLDIMISFKDQITQFINQTKDRQRILNLMIKYSEYINLHINNINNDCNGEKLYNEDDKYLYIKLLKNHVHFYDTWERNTNEKWHNSEVTEYEFAFNAGNHIAPFMTPLLGMIYLEWNDINCRFHGYDMIDLLEELDCFDKYKSFYCKKDYKGLFTKLYTENDTIRFETVFEHVPRKIRAGIFKAAVEKDDEWLKLFIVNTVHYSRKEDNVQYTRYHLAKDFKVIISKDLEDLSDEIVSAQFNKSTIKDIESEWIKEFFKKEYNWD